MIAKYKEKYDRFILRASEIKAIIRAKMPAPPPPLVVDIATIRDKAIQAAKDAVQYDTDQKFAEAYAKYTEAVQYFTSMLISMFSLVTYH